MGGKLAIKNNLKDSNGRKLKPQDQKKKFFPPVFFMGRDLELFGATCYGLLTTGFAKNYPLDAQP